MMSLQKATLFALYAVLELAAEPDRQRSAADIAERYGISTNHLAKVLRDLGKAGLVESVRGAGGGYRFCGNARRTTLMDIIKHFEDVGPAARNNRSDANPVEGVLGVVFNEIEESTHATLQSLSIETVLKLMRRGPVRTNTRSGRFRAV